MAKFVNGKTISFGLTGKHSDVYFQIDAPMCYTLYDIVQIIKMYSDYTDKYEWKFINSYDESKILNAVSDEKLDSIKFDEYRNVTPSINCIYGDLEISIEARGYLKYTKVYPTIYQATGNFPSEDNLMNDDEIIKVKRTKDELKDFDEKLKTYFKNKYKITDEIVTTYYGEQNDLVRK